MDNRYLSEVLVEMDSFFEQNGFSKDGDGVFKSDVKAIKVEYSDSRQMYTLSVADVEDGNIGEYSEINAWLFDDTQNARDAAAVGIDFADSLRGNLGIKAVKRSAAAGADIDLPTASKGENMTISGFAKKVLDMFPVFKDAYKEHIATYGNFLHLDFFGETFVPQIKTVLKENNKKQVKKLGELLKDAYVHGDRDTVNTAVAVLSAAAYGDEAVKAAAKEMLGEDKHFIASFESFLPVLGKKKKLLDLLVK